MTGIEREQAILARLAVILGDWSEFYEEVRVLKRTRVCGCSADVYIVHAVPTEAPAVTYLVNAETGLTIKSLYLSKLPLGFIGQSVTYEDYREVERVKIPFRWKGEYAIPSLGQMTLQYDTVTTRVEVADDTFRPGNGMNAP